MQPLRGGPLPRALSEAIPSAGAADAPFGLPAWIWPEGAAKGPPEEDGLSERSTDSGGGSPSADEAPAEALRLPAATLFLVDWDDTLLPTTWLDESGRLAGPVDGESRRRELLAAEECVARTLEMMRRAGQVVVVTNAQEGWVQRSAARFMPRIAQLLSGLEVLSARARYEKRAPGSPTEWKRLAFELLVGRFCGRLAPGQQANVISVGDLFVESDALLHATEDVPDCWGKSLKFQERPALASLVQEHQLLQDSLEWIVQERGGLILWCQERSGGLSA